LETLDLSCNKIGDKGCEALVPVLAQMTALETLEMGKYVFGYEGYEDFDEMVARVRENVGKDNKGRVLFAPKNLHWVYKKQIGDKGCEALVLVLAQMTALKELEVKGDDDDHNHMDEKGCEALAPVLAQLTALEKLSLLDLEIGDTGCEALAPALAQLTALKELDWFNYRMRWEIGAKGCEALAPALAQLTALKSLSLYEIHCREKGCEALAPALAQMTALEELSLSYNQIGDEGCEALAPALAQLTALKGLALSGNSIGDKGCEALVPVLTQMTALKELDLDNNSFGWEGYHIEEMIARVWENAGKYSNNLVLQDDAR
jgi:NLR family CARD domain-containing protein 3